MQSTFLLLPVRVTKSLGSRRSPVTELFCFLLWTLNILSRTTRYRNRSYNWGFDYKYIYVVGLGWTTNDSHPKYICRSYNIVETLRDLLFFEIHIDWDTGGRPSQHPEEIHFVGEIEDLEFILTWLAVKWMIGQLKQVSCSEHPWAILFFFDTHDILMIFQCDAIYRDILTIFFRSVNWAQMLQNFIPGARMSTFSRQTPYLRAFLHKIPCPVRKRVPILRTRSLFDPCLG